MTWRSKKQPVVARSSIEVDFQALTQGKYEIMWIKILLKELHIEPKDPMKIIVIIKQLSILHII